MRLLSNLKNVFLSSLPLLITIIIVTIVFPLSSAQEYFKIFIGYALVIVGQTFFLIGVDNSIIPMGKDIGSSIPKIKKMILILMFGFLFGLVATIVEPSLTVFSSQVTQVNPNINNLIFVSLVGVGTGIFVAIALFRIIRNINLKWLFVFFYLAVFILILIGDNVVGYKYVAIAFDASGATTGDISVPFILALGLGSALTMSKHKTNEESFGIIGLASIGSIIALLIYFLFLKDSALDPSMVSIDHSSPSFLTILGDKSLEVLYGIAPIIIIFFIFQLLYIKLPKNQIKRLAIATLVVMVGLYIFLVGCDYGFIEAGRQIGVSFSKQDNPEWVKYLLFPVVFILNFAVTLCEPAVTVLGDQVEALTNGFIKKNTIKITLAIGIGASGLLTILNVFLPYEWTFVVIIGPLYAIALLLMIFTPRLFVGLAFDSGGVAGGAITSAFLVPLIIAVTENIHPNDLNLIANKGFGLIAFLSITPIIAVELLGIFYTLGLKHKKRINEVCHNDYLYLRSLIKEEMAHE